MMLNGKVKPQTLIDEANEALRAKGIAPEPDPKPSDRVAHKQPLDIKQKQAGEKEEDDEIKRISQEEIEMADKILKGEL